VIVVADTSPILNLERIGSLDLLPALYGQVVIPESVQRELSPSQAVEFASLAWLKIMRASNRTLVEDLRLQVDAGEAEAIALAGELQADLLLIDERGGRTLASARGIPITGLAGVLLEAKRADLIREVKPILDELITVARFRISKDLYQRVLDLADEI